MNFALSAGWLEQINYISIHFNWQRGFEIWVDKYGHITISTHVLRHPKYKKAPNHDPKTLYYHFKLIFETDGLLIILIGKKKSTEAAL